jgi:NADH:ubiquinone oxidoreductase subunit 3 (subunit A)
MGIALAVSVFLGVGTTFMAGMLIFSWLVRPIKERPASQQSYECGYPAKGDARAIGFNYLHYAALFLVFDLAALFLFLFASIEQVPPLVTISFFLGLGTLGLMILYGTRKRRYHVA